LTGRAIAWGRDTFGDSDGGRRLPLALLGVLTVLAAAGIAMRLAGARAALATAIVLLAMPLCALQSRMLTSEIGTACGATLIVYALVALGDLRRGRIAVALIDAAVALVALAAGAALGFTGGGALLGLIAPIGGVAAAGAFGAPLIAAIRRRAPRIPWPAALVAALAGLAALALIALVAHQIYELKTPYPGMTPPPARELLGKAILPDGCYSWALGAIWRPEDDLRYIYDSTFEQIAYGSYPWGLLAPLAMAGLIDAPDARRRRLGAVTLAWAGAAWVASEAFQRKVGFTIYAGFPALAIAVGAWLDAMFAGRVRGEPGAMPSGARLIALFALVGIVDLGKDLQSFGERLTSLLVGSDGIAYPAQARIALLPARLWLLLLGVVIAGSFAIALAAWRDGESPIVPWLQRLAGRAAVAAIAVTILLAAFWPALWQPRLAIHLSSKTMFETYAALGKPGDALIVMGDLGQAPFAYTSRAPEIVPDRAQIIAALGRSTRVFAIAPQSELCTLHREVAGKPYFVLDDRNQRSLLLTNRLDGADDHNPLRTAIVHDEPRDIPVRPSGKVVWDNRIQLLGWDVPKRVARGERFEITLYYKILQPVGGTWKTLIHIDGPGGRAGIGDHDPIGGRCPTSTWQLGDYIIDRFTTSAGGGAFPAGAHEIWTGFFTGSNPNWKNMPISEAPGNMRDNVDRVKITTIALE
jgi:4-amino-4-deoxy-L-arabinose transferase-like glycosyltransferase